MGCDIHLHVEVKIKGKWQHFAQLRPRRDYHLFGKMAGVRDEDPVPISNKRGLPADATELTLFDAELWGDDGHNHGYIKAEEMRQLTEWYQSQWPGNWFESWVGVYLFGNSFAGFTDYPDERPAGLEDVRLVFWFDN